MKRATSEFCQKTVLSFNQQTPLAEGFVMRFCRLEDLEPILRLGHESFHYNAPTKREIQYALTQTHGGVFGLYDLSSKTYAGYVLLEAHAWHKNLYINTTVLRKEYRGRGLGQALYQFKDFFLTALGARNIWGHVAADNAVNIHLMKKNGYEAVRTEDAYYDDGKAAIVMRKNNAALKE